MRKFPKIFVFLSFFYFSQAQYSLPSTTVEKGYEYDQTLSIKQYLLLHPEGSEEFPLLVSNFLNCNELSNVSTLEVHSEDGELIYRSGHPSENINLINVPCALYILTIHYIDDSKKDIFFRRVD